VGFIVGVENMLKL